MNPSTDAHLTSSEKPGLQDNVEAQLADTVPSELRLSSLDERLLELERKSEFWCRRYSEADEALQLVTSLKDDLEKVVQARSADLIIAEQRAEEVGRIHATVLETMTSGWQMTRTSDARIIFANSTFERMLGYESGELLGRNVSCLNSAGVWNSDLAADAVNSVLRREGAWRGEMCNIRKDGSSIWCRVNISTFEHASYGQVWLSTHTDISQLMRADKRLRESEMRWQFAVESHGDAMWDWDVEKDRLFLTPAAKELFNLTNHAANLPIATLIARIYEDDQLAMYRQIDDMIVGKTSEWSGECRLISQNTATRWIATRGRVMTRGADGQPQSIVCISRDFTKQRAQEAESRQQSQRIAHQGRLVLLGELASALAHEINQPLTVITGLAAECKRRTENIPAAVELIDTIEAQAIRAGEIVWRMLGFARRQRSGRSALSLNEVVNGVAKWIRADIGHYSTIIDTAGVAGNLPKVDADRVELEQVLLNLVRNGIEAGLPNTREQRIAIAGHLGEHPERLEVTVTDWGCGLPNTAEFNAFLPFTSTKKDGVGLGLAICFSIVEAHGGHIWATPNPEGGTVFHFTLPIHRESEKVPREKNQSRN
jgi:PAS domain S-box-containing protein